MLLQIKQNDDSENLDYEFITNDCKLDENKNILSRNNCWFIFKKSKNGDVAEKYKLNQGDIIRFGRITTRIKEIIINKNSNTNIKKQNTENSLNDNNLITQEAKTIENVPKLKVLTFSTDLKKDSDKFINLTSRKTPKIELKPNITVNISQKTMKAKKSKICRICYEEEDSFSTFDNPLVQPCTCSGTLKYIHLNCLKQWLNTKSCSKIFKNDSYSVFLVEPVQCEICKTKFPDFLKHKDKLYEILDFKSEFENYFTFESLTLDKNNTKFIYVVNLDNNIKLRLGRGKDSQLTLGDISVSRVHAILTIENKNIYIQDNNSKFGTLILVQSPSLKIIENLPLYIQIGRTFLFCNLQKTNKNIFSCCEVNDRPNSNFYFQQNEKQKQLELIDMFNIKSDKDKTENYDYETEGKEKYLDSRKLVDDKSENNINNRYEDNTHNTLEIEANIKELKISKVDEEININVINKKSLFDNNKNENKDIENKNEIIVNKSQSIILESENEIVSNQNKIINSSENN